MFIRQNPASPSLSIDTSPDNINWTLYVLKANVVSVHPVFIANAGYAIQNNPSRPNACDITIDCAGGTKLRFSLYDIFGQPTWTTNQAGVNQCAADILAWVS